MKTIWLLLLAMVFFTPLYGQDEPQTEKKSLKDLTPEEREIVQKALTEKSAQIKANAVQNACNCIDSISTANKEAKETAKEVAKCVKKQVLAYQIAVKLIQSLENPEAKEITVTDDSESLEYKKSYYEIETALMQDCKALKEVVGVNNKEHAKSMSKNREALDEYFKGNDLMEMEKYNEAMPFYKKAVKIDPKFVFAWDNLGLCYRKMGKLKKAIAAYQKSIEIDPKGKMPLQNIAIAYAYNKEYSKAIGAYLKLSELDNENPEVYYGIGQIYFEYLKEYEKSLDYICKAYILYAQQSSPYRVDAEKIIAMNYAMLKKQGKESTFYEILKKNKITMSEE